MAIFNSDDKIIGSNKIHKKNIRRWRELVRHEFHGYLILFLRKISQTKAKTLVLQFCGLDSMGFKIIEL